MSLIQPEDRVYTAAVSPPGENFVTSCDDEVDDGFIAQHRVDMRAVDQLDPDELPRVQTDQLIRGGTVDAFHDWGGAATV